ncbi:hypothetical protein CLOSTMETH_01384 [[Clostridium] methylpentosum DSM 5476]|uniref:Uncharacterized protein n=1 Tax=[Clostridium] methylpentosum DSM 5476 TaxID=537013 RepID=C0EC15_9FIRM|nr:hypothetical protein CLOSTMETH_01384 [[Clostridium] methylpentosum DSM 5476]
MPTLCKKVADNTIPMFPLFWRLTGYNVVTLFSFLDFALLLSGVSCFFLYIKGRYIFPGSSSAKSDKNQPVLLNGM